MSVSRTSTMLEGAPLNHHYLAGCLTATSLTRMKRQDKK